MFATRSRLFVRALSALILSLALVPTGQAGIEAGEPYRTGFVRWRAVDGSFRDWQLVGTRLGADGALALDPGALLGGADPYPLEHYRQGDNYYNGGAFLYGEATSPMLATPFAFFEAIPSWNATTPPGTWLEVRLRGRFKGAWTKWYSLGVWAADESTLSRHSVDRQGDQNGRVAVDTLQLYAGADAFQYQSRLFTVDGASSPVVRNAALAYSTRPDDPKAPAYGDVARWGRVLPVPACSQMMYPDGGDIWCSPTSTAMVVAYWAGAGNACEPNVRAAVDGVYDWLYDGHGNWSFNAAYAATRGVDAYVMRFPDLASAEPWIAAGVPLVVSYGWGYGELSGAPLGWSAGHLGVLVGFDAWGNPVVNDPAAPSDQTVQRVYLRAQFEAVWLAYSGGTAYVIGPP